MTTAALAYDAGRGIGMGHRRRMEAIAAALAALGWSTALVAADEGAVADVVVVDSYVHRADRSPPTYRGTVLAALDDLGRDLAVDVVVDPSPGATAAPHEAAGLVLAGPDYAVVDPSLRDLSPRPVAETVAGVLIAMGASDQEGIGRAIASELLRRLPTAAVRLVVGPWGMPGVPAGVTEVRTDTGLAPHLADADLVVTAAGVTLLEALALGRPTVTVVVAGNQRQAAHGASAAGAALLSDPASAAGDAARLAADAGRRRALSGAAVALVDGKGADRIADALARTLATRA